MKVDPLAPSSDDHTDSLSIPMSQYTGVTTFNKKGNEKKDEQDQGMMVAILFVQQFILPTWMRVATSRNNSFYSTDFPAHVDKMHEDDDESFGTEYSVS